MKILLTHTPEMRANYYGERALAEIMELAQVRLHERSVTLSPAELIAAAGDADVIIADRLTTGPAEIFTDLPKLTAFVRCAVDIRNIDVSTASSVGVLVTRARPGFVESVTELTIGYLVDLARGISRATSEYRADQPPTVQMGRQLSGSTIGIIGYGSIGRYLATISSALGMRVLVSDPHVAVDDPCFEHVGLDTLLMNADHVVCVAVATEATKNLMNSSTFALMKRDAVFINVSRGGLVDETALEDALRDGIIAGAAMDVGRALDQMPTPTLAARADVIATPHIGGLTPPAIEAQALDTVEQVRELAAGQVPHGSVNADQWTRRFQV